MEPGLGGQEKLNPQNTRCPQAGGRNGAWPWRPGKAACSLGAGRRANRSQWSLALAARKSTACGNSCGGSLTVAMEPGLGGQEKLKQPPGSAVLIIGVAMEPGLGGQEKILQMLRCAGLPLSQWSLALAARKSWPNVQIVAATIESQWSLALAARKS